MAPKNKGKGKDNAAESSKSGSGGGGGGKLKPATSINVRHILCAKHSKKEEALQKIRDGAKFDEVAREMSEDKARQGGSLGWKVRGSLLAEFEKVAYELEPSTTGSPKIGECKTGEGYHIIMVEGRK
ncbi:putative peptidyl-prolyl cis-trans isomerase NIMA-interacting 4 [Corynespora cassiicola Philippines]|uniref:Peptidyl-prolyl cis-trans isomerase n=1 Tax=Corynespora cassiicola Philippines TaxID=1448308 RepID=A0A2T2NR90_CORCC|nr:putative peptidyl-prolyl cis-trans isomerase NIMA-interacting 4 [Corynespora cassiicola Philippines]